EGGDVKGGIREMAVLLQQEGAASSVSIRTVLAEGVPDIMADRVQLQQVLMNLMVNAIDAMKETGGDLTITSQAGEGSGLLILVSDTGGWRPTENPDQNFKSVLPTTPHSTRM